MSTPAPKSKLTLPDHPNHEFFIESLSSKDAINLYENAKEKVYKEDSGGLEKLFAENIGAQKNEKYIILSALKLHAIQHNKYKSFIFILHHLNGYFTDDDQKSEFFHGTALLCIRIHSSTKGSTQALRLCLKTLIGYYVSINRMNFIFSFLRTAIFEVLFEDIKIFIEEMVALKIDLNLRLVHEAPLLKLAIVNQNFPLFTFLLEQNVDCNYCYETTEEQRKKNYQEVYQHVSGFTSPFEDAFFIGSTELFPFLRPIQEGEWIQAELIKRFESGVKTATFAPGDLRLATMAGAFYRSIKRLDFECTRVIYKILIKHPSFNINPITDHAILPVPTTTGPNEYRYICSWLSILLTDVNFNHPSNFINILKFFLKNGAKINKIPLNPMKPSEDERFILEIFYKFTTDVEKLKHYRMARISFLQDILTLTSEYHLSLLHEVYCFLNQGKNKTKDVIVARYQLQFLVDFEKKIESNEKAAAEHITEEREIDFSSPLGTLCLLIALERDNHLLVKQILDKGADPNACLKGNYPPLMIATLKRNFKVFTVLMVAKANILYTHPIATKHCHKNQSILETALRTRQIEILYLLKKDNIPMNVRSGILIKILENPNSDSCSILLMLLSGNYNIYKPFDATSSHYLPDLKETTFFYYIYCLFLKNYNHENREFYHTYLMYCIIHDLQLSYFRISGVKQNYILQHTLQGLLRSFANLLMPPASEITKNGKLKMSLSFFKDEKDFHKVLRFKKIPYPNARISLSEEDKVKIVSIILDSDKHGKNLTIKALKSAIWQSFTYKKEYDNDAVAYQKRLQLQERRKNIYNLLHDMNKQIPLDSPKSWDQEIKDFEHLESTFYKIRLNCHTLINKYEFQKNDRTALARHTKSFLNSDTERRQAVKLLSEKIAIYHGLLLYYYYEFINNNRDYKKFIDKRLALDNFNGIQKRVKVLQALFKHYQEFLRLFLECRESMQIYVKAVSDAENMLTQNQTKQKEKSMFLDAKRKQEEDKLKKEQEAKDLEEAQERAQKYLELKQKQESHAKWLQAKEKKVAMQKEQLSTQKESLVKNKTSMEGAPAKEQQESKEVQEWIVAPKPPVKSRKREYKRREQQFTIDMALKLSQKLKFKEVHEQLKQLLELKDDLDKGKGESQERMYHFKYSAAFLLLLQQALDCLKQCPSLSGLAASHAEKLRHAIVHEHDIFNLFGNMESLKALHENITDMALKLLIVFSCKEEEVTKEMLEDFNQSPLSAVINQNYEIPKRIPGRSDLILCKDQLMNYQHGLNLIKDQSKHQVPPNLAHEKAKLFLISQISSVFSHYRSHYKNDPEYKIYCKRFGRYHIAGINARHINAMEPKRKKEEECTPLTNGCLLSLNSLDLSSSCPLKIPKQQEVSFELPSAGESKQASDKTQRIRCPQDTPGSPVMSYAFIASMDPQLFEKDFSLEDALAQEEFPSLVSIIEPRERKREKKQ